MPVNHFTPFLDKPLRSLDDLEYPGKLLGQALYKSLPEALAQANNSEILKIIQILRGIHHGHLVMYHSQKPKALLALFHRPEWQEACWLSPLLACLKEFDCLPDMPILLQLAQSPDSAISYWVFEQLQDIFFSDECEDGTALTPLLLIGMNDPLSEIHLRCFNHCLKHPSDDPVLLAGLQTLINNSQNGTVRAFSLRLLSCIWYTQMPEQLDTYYLQAATPVEQALLLNAWLEACKLFPNQMPYKRSLPIWEPRIQAALQSHEPDLQQAGAAAVYKLNLIQHVPSLAPLLTTDQPRVQKEVLQALTLHKTLVQPTVVFEVLQNSKSFEIKELAIAYLVTCHPDFSKDQLPKMIVAQPLLASTLVTKLNRLGWRHIPDTWLELSKKRSESPVIPSVAPVEKIPPDTPWLEV
jgi:hypothetical protein